MRNKLALLTIPVLLVFGFLSVQKINEARAVLRPDEQTGMIKTINSYRNVYGLSPLKESEELNQSATAKAKHMNANNYWAHDQPNGKKWQEFFPTYESAGENLARNFTESQAVAHWMASDDHRAVLRGNFEYFGKGVDGNLTVGHFIRSSDE